MRRVGWSEFASFRRCPQQQAWRREGRTEQIPQVQSEGRERGRLLHKIMERFYTERLWETPNPTAKMYAALQRAALETPNDLMSQVVVVTDLIPEIVETARREQLVGPALVEYQVSRVFHDVSIEGRLDWLVKGLDNRYRLLDGKSGKGDREQLWFYASALERTPYQPSYLGQWRFRKGTVTWIRFTPAQRVAFDRSLDRTMLDFKAGLTSPKVGSHCRYCPFTLQCEAYRVSIRNKQAMLPEVPAGGGPVSL